MNDIASVTLIKYNKQGDEEMIVEYRLTFLRALFRRPKKAQHYVRPSCQVAWYEKGVLPPVELRRSKSVLFQEWCRQSELYAREPS